MLCFVTMKVNFLLALATAKRVGELQVISACVAFHGQDLSISYLFGICCQNGVVEESFTSLLSGLLSLRLRSGSSGGACALSHPCDTDLLGLDQGLVSSSSFTVCFPSASAVFHFEELSLVFRPPVIVDAGASIEGLLPPHAHSVRGVAASAAFLHNWSISKVLEAATWRSNPIFASFYFRLDLLSMDAIPLAHLSQWTPSWLGNFAFSFFFFFFPFILCGVFAYELVTCPPLLGLYVSTRSLLCMGLTLA